MRKRTLVTLLAYTGLVTLLKTSSAATGAAGLGAAGKRGATRAAGSGQTAATTAPAEASFRINESRLYKVWSHRLDVSILQHDSQDRTVRRSRSVVGGLSPAQRDDVLFMLKNGVHMTFRNLVSFHHCRRDLLYLDHQGRAHARKQPGLELCESLFARRHLLYASVLAEAYLGDGPLSPCTDADRANVKPLLKIYDGAEVCELHGVKVDGGPLWNITTMAGFYAASRLHHEAVNGFFAKMMQATIVELKSMRLDFVETVVPNTLVLDRHGNLITATIYHAFQYVMLYGLAREALVDFEDRVLNSPDMAACQDVALWFMNISEGLSELGQECRVLSRTVAIDLPHTPVQNLKQKSRQARGPPLQQKASPPSSVVETSWWPLLCVVVVVLSVLWGLLRLGAVCIGLVKHVVGSLKGQAPQTKQASARRAALQVNQMASSSTRSSSSSTAVVKGSAGLQASVAPKAGNGQQMKHRALVSKHTSGSVGGAGVYTAPSGTSVEVSSSSLASSKQMPSAWLGTSVQWMQCRDMLSGVVSAFVAATDATACRLAAAAQPLVAVGRELRLSCRRMLR